MARALEELLEEVREFEIPTPESRVWIVDDEESVLDVLKRLIERKGFLVETNSSGLAAIAALEATDDPPRVVLVDKNLLDTTGMEVIRKGKDAHPSVEFIMITGYASMESVQEAMDVGAFGYLEKPFAEFELVTQRIDAAMAKNHTAAQNALLVKRLRESYKELLEAKVEVDLMKEIIQAKLDGQTEKYREATEKLRGRLDALRQHAASYLQFVSDTEALGGDAAARATTEKNRAQGLASLIDGIADDQAALRSLLE